MAQCDQLGLIVAGLFVAFATLGTPVEAGTCRQGPKAASEHCALPDGLGNFQGVSNALHS